MGEDAIDGRCFHPPGEQSYVCFDLPKRFLEEENLSIPEEVGVEVRDQLGSPQLQLRAI